MHWAPFAPSRCGLYEAARDCARADHIRDHEVVFCDTGVATAPGKREEPKVGAGDSRGGWLLQTSPRSDALDADLWVCHDGVPDSIAAQCQVPIVWMIHGRPLHCFRHEQENLPGEPFSIIKRLASWPRVKSLVTMWREFEAPWRMVVGDKLRCTGDPPIDSSRYRPTGDVFELPEEKRGGVNILICDSWRNDVDVYEVAVACYVAAQRCPGVKVHFWAVEEGKQYTSWQPVWVALESIGALGVINPRTTDVERVYRAMDVLVSPHMIGVRTIGEALSCGLPVVAAEGNRYTTWTGRPNDANHMADAIVRCVDALENEPGNARGAVELGAEMFNLERFGERMEGIYQEAVGAPVAAGVA